MQVNIDCDFEMTQKTQETRCLAVAVKAFPDDPECGQNSPTSWSQKLDQNGEEKGSECSIHLSPFPCCGHSVTNGPKLFRHAFSTVRTECSDKSRHKPFLLNCFCLAVEKRCFFCTDVAKHGQTGQGSLGLSEPPGSQGWLVAHQWPTPPSFRLHFTMASVTIRGYILP